MKRMQRQGIENFKRTLMAAGIATFCTQPVQAVDVFWTNPVSGNFITPGNWTPAGPPVGADRAIFDQSGSYTVDLFQNILNDEFLIEGSIITLDLNGNAYNLVNRALIGDVSASAIGFIQGGGIINSDSFWVGNQAGSFGQANVANTTWDMTSILEVGALGSAIVTLTTGTDMTVGTDAYIAGGPGSSGVLNLFNAGTTLTVDNELFVGNLGTGTFNINSGASTTSALTTIGNSVGALGTATVDGAGSSWNNTGIMRVANQANGTLNVQNGGAVTSASATLGNVSGVTGTLNVDGTGSQFTSTSNLNVGSSGTGNLSVTSGGTVNADVINVADQGGSVGNVTIDGAGSTVNVTGSAFSDLYIGGNIVNPAGIGTVNVQNGGTLNVQGLLELWNTGTLNITGGSNVTAGSADLSNGGTFNLDQGFFTVQGGTLTTDSSGLSVDGGDAVLTLDNAAYSTGGSIQIGASDTGTFNILNGATVNSATGSIGGSGGGIPVGVVTIDGTGSRWDADSLIVGSQADGTVNVTDGGVLDLTSLAIIGNASGSVGQVSVDGAGSLFQASGFSGNIRIGSSGVGTLDVTNGAAVVATQDVSLGLFGTGNGTATIDGAGSSLTVEDDLIVGDSGDGVLNVQNGATTVVQLGDLIVNDSGGGAASSGMLNVQGGASVDVQTGDAIIGSSVSDDGFVNVDGAGSTLTINDQLIVDGDSLVSITNGGSVNADSATVDGTMSNPTITVNGAGSTLAITNGFTLGSADIGNLNVQNGGSAASGMTTLGSDAGATGNATVSGVGSSWNAGSNVDIGSDGDGVVNVLAGGQLDAEVLNLGVNVGSTGTLLVDGTGSTVNVTAGINAELSVGGFPVGAGGSGDLTIQNSGAVNVDHFMNIYGNGATTVQSGGSLTVGTLVSIESGGELIVQDSGSANVTGTLSNDGLVTVQTNGQLTTTGALNNTGTIDLLGGAITTGSYNTLTGTLNHDAGTLTILNGSFLTGTGPGMALDVVIDGSNPIVTLDNSNWNTNADVVVATTNQGIVNVTNGSTVETDKVTIGDFSGGGIPSGIINVDGASSSWTISSPLGLTVGEGGDGALNVNNGGAFTSTSIGVGEAGGSGVINVDGAGSSLTATAGAGTEIDNGSINISNGGSFDSATVIVGDSASITGALLVDGTGSSATTTANLQVGGTGTGNLTIQNGGSVAAGPFLWIATQTGSSGTATVSGAGSSLSADEIDVGRNGNGTLVVQSGASVTTPGDLRAGVTGNGLGDIDVLGSGTTVGVTGDILLGMGGVAILDIESGASVSADNLSAGLSSLSFGDIDVDAATLTITNTLALGDQGSSALTISNGGSVSATTANLGLGSGGTNPLNVTGAGSSFSAAVINAGVAGLGTVIATNNGIVTAGEINASTMAGANGNLVVTSGGTINVTGTGTQDVFIGGSAAGAGGISDMTMVSGNMTVGDDLTIYGAGSVTIDGGSVLTIADTLTNSGSFTLQSGTVTTTSADFQSGSSLALANGLLTVQGGTLDTALGTVSLGEAGNTGVALDLDNASWTTTDAVRLGDGTSTLNVTNGANVTTGNATVGLDTLGASNASALVDGAATNWTINGVLGIGNVGLGAGSTGLFTIGGGATVSANSTVLGDALSPTSGAGTVNVNGPGSTLDAGSSLTVNDNSSVAITQGGTVLATEINLDGTISASDLGSAITVAGDIATSASAVIDISDGATLSANNMDLGAGDSGTTTVSGAGSTMSIAQRTNVRSVGDLMVTQGGSFTTELIFLKAGGTITVSDVGSSVVANSPTTVGLDLAGDVNVLNGGNFLINGHIMDLYGFDSGANAITVSGAGSLLQIDDGISAAGGNKAITVSISDGGELEAGGFSAGMTSTGGDQIDVLVTGGGSLLDVNGGLALGADSSTLSITDGGVVDASQTLNFRATTVIVDGVGSALDGGTTIIGDMTSDASLTVQNGAALTVGDFRLGSSTFSSGNTVGATITGSGTTADISDLDIGNVPAGSVSAVWRSLDQSVTNALDVTVSTGGTLEINNATFNANSIALNGGQLDWQSGNLGIASGLTIGSSGVFGSSLSIDTGKTLTVGPPGGTTVEAGGSLSLDGGVFSTGSLTNNGTFVLNSGTFNLTSDDLLVGVGGPFGDVFIPPSTVDINVTNNVVVEQNAILRMENDSLSAAAINNAGEVQIDALKTLTNVAVINNSGDLLGNGQVGATLNNQTGGEVFAQAGDRLKFTNTGNTNSGEINLVGGTIEFNEEITNNADGVIGGFGTLDVNNTITNNGLMAFSGTTVVFADINTTDQIIASGGSTLSLFGDVDLISGEIRAGINSGVVYFGNLNIQTGATASGTGTHFFEGGLTIGSSPGEGVIDADAAFGFGNTLEIELAGETAGTEFDTLSVAGSLTLGGTLDIDLLEDYNPDLGDIFVFAIAEEIFGSFDELDLPTLQLGQFQLIQTQTSLALEVVSAAPVPLPPAAWMLVSGMTLLGAIRRRKNSNG
ncbi:MAG: hypothetical protein AAF384_08630 [Pseudomonadota bacterium]